MVSSLNTFQKFYPGASAILSAILMGALGYFVRESSVSAGGCAFIRFLTGLVLVGGVMVCARAKFNFSRGSFFSGMAISVCILLYFLALQQTTLGTAAFLLYLGPIFATLGEAVLMRKCPPRTEIALIALALTGLICVSVFSGSDATTTAQNNQLGIFLGIGAGLSYAAYIVLMRQVAPEVGVLQRTFWQFLAGTLVIAVYLLFTQAPFAYIETGWPYLIVIGVCHGFLVLLLVAYAVKHLTAIQFGTISYIEPLVAALVGFFVWSEKMTLLQGVGYLLIVVSTLLQSIIHIHHESKDLHHEKEPICQD